MAQGALELRLSPARAVFVPAEESEAAGHHQDLGWSLDKCPPHTTRDQGRVLSFGCHKPKGTVWGTQRHFNPFMDKKKEQIKKKNHEVPTPRQQQAGAGSFSPEPGHQLTWFMGITNPAEHWPGLQPSRKLAALHDPASPGT